MADNEPKKLAPQKIIIQQIRERVDAWRGYSLQNAKLPYPKEPAKYAPVNSFEKQISQTTETLLRHWFRPFPHELRDAAGNLYLFKYWPHQRRTVETFIYLYEVCGVKRRQDIEKIIDFKGIVPQRDQWTKLGAQLATGSGKTKIMSLVIAWSYLNAVIEGEDHLGIGKHSIVIAPNLFVLDRLLEDFSPSEDKPDVFNSDPVIPKELERYWNLKVYSPSTVPTTLDPDEGALVVTNIHKLYKEGETLTNNEEVNLSKELALFEGAMPKKLENEKNILSSSFKNSFNILIINDEAHHVHDEDEHKNFEAKIKQLKEAGAIKEKMSEELGWIRSIRNLDKQCNVGLQVDLSATLFEEKGSVKKQKGNLEEVRFRWTDLFKHTVGLYSLAEAKLDGIIKIPKLEKVKVYRGNDIKDAINQEKVNAWEKYENLLRTGIKRWQVNQDKFDKEGDKRKQILFIICNDRKEAAQIYNYMVYGELDDEGLDLSESGKPIKGFYDEDTRQTLFVKNGKTTVTQIHIGEKELNNEKDWDIIRKKVHLIDKEYIEDPELKGEQIENPFNVVVAVLMLKEGWDVRNVKTIIPLRKCDSRTLTEQTLGRGLRRMHQPRLDEDGAATASEDENLYIIEHPSFAEILSEIEDIVDEVETGEVEKQVYTLVSPLADENVRRVRNVRMLKFSGLIENIVTWYDRFKESDLPNLEKRFPWVDKAEKTKIITELEKEKGLEFEFEESVNYVGLNRVLISAYVKPILSELRMSYSFKLQVLDIVKKFLETKVFDLQPGTSLKLDSVNEDTDKIVKRNVFDENVMPVVKREVIRLISDLRSDEKPKAEKLELKESRGVDAFQALMENVLENPTRAGFDKQCMQNNAEYRVAQLLDGAEDITGWIYNDLKGVGYNIEYLWQSSLARYFPDFIVRATEDGKKVNYIVEVKGKEDERDVVKKERGQKYVELLTQTDPDKEEWRYLYIREDSRAKIEQLKWWENRSVTKISDLYRYIT